MGIVGTYQGGFVDVVGVEDLAGVPRLTSLDDAVTNKKK